MKYPNNLIHATNRLIPYVFFLSLIGSALLVSGIIFDVNNRSSYLYFIPVIILGLCSKLCKMDIEDEDDTNN